MLSSFIDKSNLRIELICFYFILNNYYKSFKDKIAKSKLNADMMNQLHSAYQGQFKDWLYTKGYNKNLIDLVKMIDKQ